MPARFRIAAALFAASIALPGAAQEVIKPVAKFSTCAKPVWPREALRYDQQGTVTLAFLIAADGTVKESKVTRSSGFPLLDTAAQEGLEKCQFQPGSKDGDSVESWAHIQYVWTLKPKTVPAPVAESAKPNQ